MTETERPWLEAVEQVGVIGVRDLLLESGLSPAKAAGIAIWLDDQANRRRHIDGATATRYRHLLAALEPPERSPKLRAIPGYRNLPPPLDRVAA